MMKKILEYKIANFPLYVIPSLESLLNSDGFERPKLNVNEMIIVYAFIAFTYAAIFFLICMITDTYLISSLGSEYQYSIYSSNYRYCASYQDIENDKRYITEFKLIAAQKDKCCNCSCSN